MGCSQRHLPSSDGHLIRRFRTSPARRTGGSGLSGVHVGAPRPFGLNAWRSVRPLGPQVAVSWNATRSRATRARAAGSVWNAQRSSSHRGRPAGPRRRSQRSVGVQRPGIGPAPACVASYAGGQRPAGPRRRSQRSVGVQRPGIGPAPACVARYAGGQASALRRWPATPVASYAGRSRSVGPV